MEKITGTVANLRNTVNVSGGENSSVTTIHIAIFQIAGRQIKAKSNEPPMINENDQVIVVGITKKGIFNALAHKNLTTSVEGNEGWILRLRLGAFLPCIGVAALSAFAGNSYSAYSEPIFLRIFPKIIGGVFVVFGIYNLYYGLQVRRAVSEL